MEAPNPEEEGHIMERFGVARLLVLALFLVATLPADGAAQVCSAGSPCGTIVTPGVVPAGTTWTQAGSPYCVPSSITVSTLTIHPGVCVLLGPGATISVQSTIIAVGTKNKPIVFTEQVAGSPWGGMHFLSAPPTSKLVHCIFEKASDSAIRLIDSTPTIEDCQIRDNTSSGRGGGIRATFTTGRGLVITRTQFLRNHSLDDGGGLFADMMTGSPTTGTLVLTDCAFIENKVIPNAPGSYSLSGGGASVVGHSLLIRCEFRRNILHAFSDRTGGATAQGGGLRTWGGDAALENCFFAENQSLASGSFNIRRAWGGAIGLERGTLSAFNCILLGNTTSGEHQSNGAGFYINSGSAEMINCTVARNNTHGLFLANGTLTQARNCIFWENNGNGMQVEPGALIVAYSCVQGGHAGATNISVDPKFVQPGMTEMCDVSILPSSPCIDAGDPDPVSNDACHPPSYALSSPPAGGQSRNDMGAHGGPRACNWASPTATVMSYCTAKTTSCGTTPVIAASGDPSASATSGFLITGSEARAGHTGMLLYTATGRGNQPFQGGTLCLDLMGLGRGIPVIGTGGTPGPACDARFEIDWNAFASGALGGGPHFCLGIVGHRIDVQWWGRDSLAHGSYLSDALEYVVGL
jgi:hypothetical protein